MFDPRQPKYQWGQRVAAQVDLFNDGSHPEVSGDALLVALGTAGEIVQIGHHADANLPIYIVEFHADTPCVVGATEEEIAPL